MFEGGQPMIRVLNDNSGRITTLEIEHFFNIYNIKEIDTIWKEEIDKKPKIIKIDCATINSIDSPAIGMLVKFKNEASNNNVELILDNVREPLLNLFRTTNLIKFFSIKTAIGA